MEEFKQQIINSSSILYCDTNMKNATVSTAPAISTDMYLLANNNRNSHSFKFFSRPISSVHFLHSYQQPVSPPSPSVASISALPVSFSPPPVSNSHPASLQPAQIPCHPNRHHYYFDFDDESPMIPSTGYSMMQFDVLVKLERYQWDSMHLMVLNRLRFPIEKGRRTNVKMSFLTVL